MNAFVKTASFLLALLMLLLPGCASKDLLTLRQEAYHSYQSSDYTSAVQKFEVLVQEVPGDGELWFRLGNAYARSMQPQQAVSAYQNALIRDPQLKKAWYNMGLIQMRSALKAFIDMQDYVDENDPVGRRGKVMRDGLFNLLGQDNEKK